MPSGKPAGPVLLVPACEPGRGGGHLGRSLFLLRRLTELGREAYLWIPENLKDDVVARFGDFFKEPEIPAGRSQRLLSGKGELSGRSWDCIVLDRFKTPFEEFIFWSEQGPLVGIDEGGPCRKRFDFLVDLLPGIAKHGPNTAVPGLLPLPKNRRYAKDGIPPPWKGPLKILICFGAEDAAGLGRAAARVLARNIAARHADLPEITLVAPGAGDGTEGALPGLTVLSSLPELKEHLAEYGLFITHFGLGAFEAVYAGVPAALVAPSAYHEKLARNAGFFSLGVTAKGLRRLGRIDLDSKFIENLRVRGGEIARRFGLEEDRKIDLGDYIHGLEIGSPGACPLCGARAGFPLTAAARFARETYRRCKRCGVFFLGRLNAPPVEYAKEYFFEFYKKQYGKTYLEDFPNLKEAGRKRLAHIRSLLNSGIEKPSLLDIGCAYGPFLAAAAEAGFSPAGVEPAEDAARYTREELGFPVWRGLFPGALPASENVPGRFDAVTLWYVIEHFRNPGEALTEIRRLLKTGGVVAFSTPSFSGISGGKSRKVFLERSPADHWTVWSPGICKKVLRQYGFVPGRIVVTGHHPERFPLLGRFADPAGKNLVYRLLLFVSRLFRLGDTFEVYGVKSAGPL